MSTNIFDWKEDHQGNEGWVMRGYDHFDTTGVDSFAHDVIEHLPCGIKHGRIADELLALGARLHARVESGWWLQQRHFGKPADVWATEIVYLLDAMRREGIDVKEIGPTPALENAKEGLTNIEPIIVAAVAKAVEQYNFDLYDDDDDNDEARAVEDETMQRMASWLRRGVLAARARFKGRFAEEIMFLNEEITHAMRQYQHGEHGQSLVIRVNEKYMDFTVRLISPP